MFWKKKSNLVKYQEAKTALLAYEDIVLRYTSMSDRQLNKHYKLKLKVAKLEKLAKNNMNVVSIDIKRNVNNG